MHFPYRFGPGWRHTLDPVSRILLRDGQATPLGSRAFEVLLALCDAQGALVPKEQLLQRAWPGLQVEEANVHVQISNLRKLLGPEAIATAASVGYRLAWPVRRGGSASPGVPLPAARTRFIGRQALLAAITRRLQTTRLLTLAGIGGSGKTRLALQVAARAPSDADHAVAWVDLAPLAGAESLAAAACAATAVPVPPGQLAAQALGDAWRNRTLLLVLDNCEHLLPDVAALVDHLLDAAAGVTVLATSRLALGLMGEEVMQIPPMQVPAPGAAHDITLASDSVQLFLDRAARVSTGPEPVAVDLDTVGSICRRLDGLPLALELAAAQLRVLSAAQLLQGLHERAPLSSSVTGSARNPRQTMQAVMDWSWHHLPPDECRLLVTLALCSGGCSFDALQALHADELSRTALLAGLDGLAAQGLVDVRHGTGPARYHLLETVRQYTLDRLQDPARRARLERRYILHFLALAEQHDADIHLHDEGQASMRRVDVDLDNCLHAITLCAQEPGAEAATLQLRFVSALRDYWTGSGRAALGLALTAAALARCGLRRVDRWQMVALGSNVHLLGWFGRFDEALRGAEDLLRLALDQPDREARISAQLLVAVALQRLERPAAARPHLAAACQMAEAEGNLKRQADAMAGLVWSDLAEGHVDHALVRGEQVLVLRRRIGHRFGLSMCLLDTARIALRAGDPSRARTALTEATPAIRGLGARTAALLLVDQAADLAAASGDAAAVVRFRSAASARRAEAGPPWEADEERVGQAQLASARRTLDAGTYQQCWTAGQPLSSEALLDAVEDWLVDP